MGSSERAVSDEHLLDEKLASVASVLSEVQRDAGEIGLITVRHGLSLSNVSLQEGPDDDHLSPQGEEQARKGSGVIRRLDLDAVLVSPFTRTRQTAALLLEGTDTAVRFEPLCVERSVGELTGLTEDEILVKFPGLESLQVGGVRFWHAPPGGELIEEVRARASELLEKILAEYKGKTVLLVSHGTLMLQLHGLLRGLDARSSLEQPFDQVWNCALNAFRISAEGEELGHALVQLAPVNDEFPISREMGGTPGGSR